MKVLLINILFVCFFLNACFPQQNKMQKKTKTEVAEATSFLEKQWRYTGQWTSDGAKPFFNVSNNVWKLSFKQNEAFADEKKFANFKIKNGLLMFENIEKDSIIEGFYHHDGKAFFHISLNNPENKLLLNPSDENGILICDEGCELVFEIYRDEK